MKNDLLNLRNEQKNETSYIKRFIAYGIDWYLGSFLSSIPLIMLYMSLHDDATYIPQVLSIFEAPYNIIAGLLSLSVAVIYYAVIPAYIYKGQTIGKKLLGLKIINDNFEDASVQQIFIRQIIMILIIEGSIYTASHMLYQLISVISGYPLTNICNYIGIFASVISVILVIVLKSKKSLHDVVVHTLVVDTKSNQYAFQIKKNKKARKKELKLS